jgi:indole-3-glycerol phosphate synthase
MTARPAAAMLDEILAHKRLELEEARRRVPPAAMRARAEARAREEAPRGFRAALRTAPRPRVVAELKRRSPSRGEIRADFDPVGCAKAYADAGAAALSVLTDARYFGGSLALLEAVRTAVAVPLLRKDFLIDAYQVDEARAHGADAVLLIARALEPARLRALREYAVGLGLDALVEVHDEGEVEAALAAGADLVGINNRDLATFETDLAVSERLAPLLAGRGVVVVAESGIFTQADVGRLEAAGADAVLVGEALMRERDVGRALAELRGRP